MTLRCHAHAVVEGRDLIIEGERKSESEVKDEHYYRMERTFGSFYRRLPLPEGVTSEDVHAEYKEGILEIRLPELAPTAPARQINHPSGAQMTARLGMGSGRLGSVG